MVGKKSLETIDLQMRYYSFCCNALKFVLLIHTVLKRNAPVYKNISNSLILLCYFLIEGTEKVAVAYKKGRMEGTEKVAWKVQKRSHGRYRKGRRESCPA